MLSMTLRLGMVRKFKTDKKIQEIIKKLSYLYTGPKTMLGLSELLSQQVFFIQID